MFGLRMSKPPYLHVQKATVFVASHEVLLERFRNAKCQYQHTHASITSLSKSQHFVPSREMQVWPSQLCRTLAAGIADLVHQHVFSHRRHDYVGTSRRGNKCPGCRRHRRKDDPEHDRGPNCVYRDITEHRWECPACQRNQPRSDARHRLDETCRWTVASNLPGGLSRERTGRHPRDGRVPASSEPTAEVRLRDLAERASIELRQPEAASSRAVPSTAARTRDALIRGRAALEQQREARVERRSTGTQVDNSGLGARECEGVPAEPEGENVQTSASADEPRRSEESSWSKFDIGRALQELRSNQPGIVRRAMRRLHLRWYHAPAARMESLLQAAGVHPRIISIAKQVVDTCQVCRAWARPSPRAVATAAVPSRFNQLVQCDLLFVRDKIVLHMIDVCTRYTATEVVTDRNTSALLSAFQVGWFKLFGPPKAVVVDQEGGLTGPEAAAWFEARTVSLEPRAKNQHADMVERHHEILRRQIHLLEGHTNNEGLRASFTAILAEATYAKNILFNVGGATPYEAVFGRVPPLIAVVSHETGEMVDDRDADRLRHLALQSMMQSTAEQKAQRAARTKTRMPGEALELQVGDSVEFWRSASTKDLESWHGPATITDLTGLRDGQLSVRWQGRSIACRVQDVRRALTYSAFLGVSVINSPVRVLQLAAEGHGGIVIRVGWFRQKGSWRACESNARYAQELLAGLHVAACNLQFHGVVSFRFGSSLASIAAVDCDESMLVWWDLDKMDCWRHAFMAGGQHVNFQRLCGQPGQNVAFIQFFAEDEEAIMELRTQVVDIPNVGGVFEPSLPQLTDLTNEVNMRARARRAIEDVASEQVDGPQVFDIQTPDDVHTEAAETVTESEDVESAMLVSTYLGFVPEVCIDSACEAVFLLNVSELAEAPQLLFPHTLAYLLPEPQPSLTSEQMVCLHVEDQPYSVIERVHNVLTREEALAHESECRIAMVKELGRWHKHDAWERMSRTEARNLLTSKWVLKWKQIEGKRDVKARLVVQGFKDNQPVRNFSATTTRWGQRLVLICAVQFGWSLISADVSEAFLRGLTFEELHRTGEDKVLRNVQMLLPPGAEQLLRTLPGFENYCGQTECLKMKKPGFGLKDAPRLWGLALRKVLKLIGLTATQVDPQLFLKHDGGKLVLLVSVHVDDLKLTGVPVLIQLAITKLEEAFDALKIEKDNFDHLGLRHKLLDDGSRSVDQMHYVAELRPIPQADLKLKDPESVVDSMIAQQYMSLLGGVAWTIQTRPDAAVFVSALQRHLKQPRVRDILNLNRVLKYLKVKPLALTYHKIEGPWKLLAISDSAFKGEDQDCLAVRSGIIALCAKHGVQEGRNSLQVIEFTTKKQTKVCRSTFAAELHSSLDLVGTAQVIRSVLSEILEGPQSAAKLADELEEGRCCIRLDAVIDAMSVWQSVVSEEPKCTDQLVLLHLCKMREVARRCLDKYVWCDTRSMLADGLTKGVISRDALRQLASEGTWQVSQPLKEFKFVKHAENQ